MSAAETLASGFTNNVSLQHREQEDQWKRSPPSPAAKTGFSSVQNIEASNHWHYSAGSSKAHYKTREYHSDQRGSGTSLTSMSEHVDGAYRILKNNAMG